MSASWLAVTQERLQQVEEAQEAQEVKEQIGILRRVFYDHRVQSVLVTACYYSYYTYFHLVYPRSSQS